MNGEYTGGDVQKLVDAVVDAVVWWDVEAGEASMRLGDWRRIRAAAEKLRQCDADRD